MTMKTGKGWVDIGKAVLADCFLEIAIKVSFCLVPVSCKCAYLYVSQVSNSSLDDCFVFQSIENLYTRLMKRSNGEADIHVHKADVEKDLFKVLSYQAESVRVLTSFLCVSPALE